MEYINAAEMKSGDLNPLIKKALQYSNEVKVQNPHSMHNIAIGLRTKGRVVVDGSTGFYTGGFLEGASVIVEGNTGWYAGDNMMDGELIITKNTGCNAGAYFNGGTMIIYGGTGARVGYGMKGGTIIVCGPSGRWAGQMTLGGRLVLLGEIGDQIGESMYRGAIFVKDAGAASKLGGNVFIDTPAKDEITELNEKFAQYRIDADAAKMQVIRPLTSGRHTYVLFKPHLEPELSNRKGKIYE